MDNRFLVEVYLDSVESAVAAQDNGASRVELCDNLLEGGTTPSVGMIRVIRQSIKIPIHAIIRPRGGDFLYSDYEYQVMKYDITVAKVLGVDGIVIGILREDGTVDSQRTGELITLARPMSVTFHRAFDMTIDPYKALEDLIQLGVDRVLTSGQEPSVIEGLDLIEALFKQAAGRITIMPCGGINTRNIQKIIERTGAKEIHAGGMIQLESSMKFRNTHCFMGGEFRLPEYSRALVDQELIRNLTKMI
jgi:copper homeostasis protein